MLMNSKRASISVRALQTRLFSRSALRAFEPKQYPPTTKICIANVDDNATRKELEKVLLKHVTREELVKLEWPRKKTFGCFLTAKLSSLDAANKLMEASAIGAGLHVAARRLSLAYAPPKPTTARVPAELRPGNGRNLMVAKLPKMGTEEAEQALQGMFEVYGEVNEVRVAVAPGENSRRWARVALAQKAAADEIVAVHQREPFKLGSTTLDVHLMMAATRVPHQVLRFQYLKTDVGDLRARLRTRNLVPVKVYEEPGFSSTFRPYVSGYLKFALIAHASKALAILSASEFDGEPIDIRYADARYMDPDFDHLFRRSFLRRHPSLAAHIGPLDPILLDITPEPESESDT